MGHSQTLQVHHWVGELCELEQDQRGGDRGAKVLGRVAEKCPVSVPQRKKKRLAWLQAFELLSGAAGDRTPDLMTASHALSHLSYSPSPLVRER
jgi:hypothetical protein